MTDTTQKTLGQISYEAQQAYYARTFPNWRIEQWASLSSHKRNSEEGGAEAIAAPLLARIAELTKELDCVREDSMKLVSCVEDLVYDHGYPLDHPILQPYRDVLPKLGFLATPLEHDDNGNPK